MCAHARLLTLNVVAGHELQHLINEDDREGKLQHHEPLLNSQMGQLEDHLWGEREAVITDGTLQWKAASTILQCNTLKCERERRAWRSDLRAVGQHR